MSGIRLWGVRLALFFSLLMPLSQVAQATPVMPVVRFAPLPMASLEQMTREYLPFLDYLEKRTGRRFELAYHASYDELLKSLAAGEVDLAYLGPLPYVVLTEQTDSIIPIVQLLDSKGASDYTCAIVHFADHPAHLVHVGRPHRVALTQPLSTCGYLAVERYLNQHQHSLESDLYEYTYAGSHENVAMGVILDDFDLGGVKTQIARRYQHLGLRVVDETDPVPGFVLVANRDTLATDFVDLIRESMLTLHPREDERDRNLVRAWSANLRYGARMVDDQAYESIRKQWRELKIDLLRSAE